MLFIHKILIAMSLFIVTVFCYFYMDLEVSILVRDSMTDRWHTFFEAVTLLGESQYPLIGSLLLYIVYRKHNYKIAKKSAYIFGSVALAGIIVAIIKVIAGRMRPELYFNDNLYGFSGFHLGNAFNSFPSGHSATAFAFLVSLSLLFPRYRYWFIGLAAAVALSRVMLLRHYVSDVLIGSLIGTLTALIVYKVFLIARKKRTVLLQPAF